MNLPSIVFLDASTLNRDDLDLRQIERLGAVTLHSLSSHSEILARMRDAEIVITNKAVIDATVIDGSARLRLIAICATGTNNVDLIAAKKRGIAVANVAGYGTFAVAQHAITFILNWATQMHRYIQEPQAWCRAPSFTRLDYPVFELSGRRLGLIGTGKIGRQVGRLAEALGMTVQAWARDGRSVSAEGDLWPRLSLPELMKTSDVVSLHCPLTDATRRIINRESLSWMKKGSYLVNTGRGDLVDELALKEALQSGRLDGAGLDVLSLEPPPPDHPLIQLQHPNLMITPHSAWTTYEARCRLLQETMANIEAFLSGRDRNRVA